jgi:hypothetical protein
MTTFTRTALITTVLLAILFASASAKSSTKLNGRQPGFLKRSVATDGCRHCVVRQTLHEADVLNCNSSDDSESDSEARFAFQYENEQEFLRRSENGYLLRNRKHYLDSSVIPASTISTRAKSNSGVLRSDLLFVWATVKNRDDMRMDFCIESSCSNIRNKEWEKGHVSSLNCLCE